MAFKKTYFSEINLLSYLIILLPIFLISGPFLTDLVISILAVFFFVFVREKKFYLNYFFLFFCLFYIVLVISSCFADFKYMSLKSSLFYFRFGFFSLFFWYLIEKNKKILSNIFYILLFCFIAIFIDSFYQFSTGSNILNMKIVFENRVSSFFGDELKMGSYLVRLFPILLSLYFFVFNDKSIKEKLYINIFFLFLLQTSIFLSGERTSFFLFVLVILLFLIFLNKLKSQKIFILCAYLIFTFSLLSFDSPFKERIINLTISQTQIAGGDKIQIFSKQYHEHYISAWRMFKNNKVIGVGPKNFREKCKEREYYISDLTCSTHPHNTFLQILAETGLIGFAFYLITNFIIWYSLFKSLFYKLIFKKLIYNNFQISLFIAISISIFPFSPSGNFFNNWISAIYYFPVGILIWSLGKETILDDFFVIKWLKKQFTKIKKFV